MKKTFLVVFLVLVGQLSAQILKLGITGSVHRTSIANIHDYSKPSWGGSFGAFGEIPLVENDIFDSAWLFLMPQLEFSKQGENASPPQGKQQFANYYLGLPIYIKYFFHRDGWKSDIFLMAGPRFEYLLHEVRKGPEVYKMFADQEKNINKLSYGLSVGAGIRVQDDLEVFLKFDRGFSKVYSDYVSKDLNYNRMIGMGVNYYFSTFE